MGQDLQEQDHHHHEGLNAASDLSGIRPHNQWHEGLVSLVPFPSNETGQQNTELESAENQLVRSFQSTHAWTHENETSDDTSIAPGLRHTTPLKGQEQTGDHSQ